MIEWWTKLDTGNQVFYGLAAFFSIVFLWQFISSLVGLAGGAADVEAEVDTDVDTDAGVDVDEIEAHSPEEAAETVTAFRLLSIRAILAFCTLFCWAGALYYEGHGLPMVILIALGWGLGGWLLMTVVINLMRRLAETGTARLSTCVGTRGSVYMDIPAGGLGQVRVKVSGAISMVGARAAGGEQLEAGTAIRVLRTLDHSTVEVEPIQSREEGKEDEE